MQRYRFFATVAFAPVLALVLIFRCELPQDPTDPTNTSVRPVLRNSDWTVSNQSITDTVGNIIQVGAAVNLPENIDSLRITFWGAETAPLFDTLVTSLGTQRNDTVWKKIYFVSAGQKTVTITPYSSLNLQPVTVRITIVDLPGPLNSKPSISVGESVTAGPAEPCSVAILTSDADAGQLLTVSMAGQPATGVLQGNSLFVWTPPAGFVGADTIAFFVTDNGKPPLCDTAYSIITVTATPHQPTIEAVGNRTIKPLETCTLTLRTTDKDVGQQLSITMSGNPEGSAIVSDSLFVWTAPAGSAGTYDIRFTVTDDGTPRLSGSAAATITVVDAAVNHAPKWALDSLPVSLNDTATYTLSLETQGTDIDGDALTYTLLPGSPTGDTIVGSQYSFTATAAAIGRHVAAIVVADPEGAKDTLYIAFEIESSVTDNTPPVITLVAPANDSGISTAATYTLEVVCTDASGIKSVSATVGSTTISATPTDGHYLMTVSGLTSGVYTAITLSATDASGNANKRAKTVYVKYSPGFTVTYNGHGSTDGTVPVDGGIYETGATVTVRANTGNLVKTGSAFVGWNTAANGSGTAYAAGATFAMGAANDTLYAQWTTNQTYIVVYYGNGSTGGTIPVDAGAYEVGSTVTVKANTGSLVKTGATFAGWNTAADGSGAAYAAEATLTMPSGSITLYAQWTVKQYSVAYNGNGNSGGAVPNDALLHDSASSVMVAANTGGLTRIGYTFTGWNTAANGSGTSYTPGTGSFIIHGNSTLYATWAIKTYTLTYNGNGNGGGSVPASGSPLDSNTLITIPGNTGGLTRMGHEFSGWNTAANGSGTAYAAGATLRIRSDTTLFAQWAVKRYSVTVTSSSVTRGTVNPSGNVTVDSGATTNILATAIDGYSFVNWAVTTGSAAIANPASASTTVALFSGDAAIVANWELAQLTVTYDANGGTGTVPISDATYTMGQTVTVLANPGKLTNGSASFVGWNVSPDGTGTNYSCRQTFVIGTQKVRLYAKYSTGSVMDNDGNQYTTVQIGGQVWLAQNLKTTTYNDGTPIPLVTGNDDWSILNTPGYCWYGNDITNRDIYGGLYNWHTVNTHKLAPAGWHVASDNEWATLIVFCDVNAAEKLRADSPLWSSGFPNLNTTRFSALPGGWREPDGVTSSSTSMGMWWSSTQNDDIEAMCRRIFYFTPDVYNLTYPKVVGLSVRCIRDN